MSSRYHINNIVYIVVATDVRQVKVLAISNTEEGNLYYLTSGSPEWIYEEDIYPTFLEAEEQR